MFNPTSTLAFLDGLGGPEMLLIFILSLMLFGGKKLPELARGIGKSVREFKRAAAGVEEEIRRAMDAEAPPTPPVRPKPPVRSSLPAPAVAATSLDTEDHDHDPYDHDEDHYDYHKDHHADLYDKNHYADNQTKADASPPTPPVNADHKVDGPHHDEPKIDEDFEAGGHIDPKDEGKLTPPDKS